MHDTRTIHRVLTNTLEFGLAALRDRGPVGLYL